LSYQPPQSSQSTTIAYDRETADTGSTLTSLDAPEMPFGPDKKKFYGTSSLNETFWDSFVYKPTTPGSEPDGIWVKLSHLPNGWAWQASVNFEANGWSWLQKPELNEPQPDSQDGLPDAWTCPYA